jgi:hypothetical protein
VDKKIPSKSLTKATRSLSLNNNKPKKVKGKMITIIPDVHIHKVNGVIRYMACETHADSVKKEYVEDEFGKKKKKYTKKYKYSEYAAFVNKPP